MVIASQIIEGAREATFQLPSASLVPDPAHDPRVGYAIFAPDFDGKIRQLSFATTQAGYNGRSPQPADPVYSSLLAAALRQLGRANLIPGNGGARPFRYTDLRNGRDYAPHSLWEIFSDATWKQNFQEGRFFENKIVIVGAAAPTLQDFQATPFGEIPGPDLQLQALTAALGQDYIAFAGVRTDFALILAAGVLAWCAALAVRQPLARLGVFAAASLAFVCVLEWFYSQHGVVALGFTPLLAFNLSGLTGLIGEYTVERAEKARVRGVLDRLVSKDIVRELLLKTARRYAAAGARPAPVRDRPLFRRARVHLADSEVRRPTPPRSSRSSTNTWARWSTMVFKHQRHARTSSSATRSWRSGAACTPKGADADARAAGRRRAGDAGAARGAQFPRWLRGRQTARDRNRHRGQLRRGDRRRPGQRANRRWRSRSWATPSTSPSRLEGLTRDYGLDLLIGESVARRVSEVFRLRTVDLVRVKGKKQAVRGDDGDRAVVRHCRTEAHEEFLFADYEDAILLYRQAGVCRRCAAGCWRLCCT